MSIFEQATLLFANMDFVTLSLLIVGIVCLIGEIYQPGTVVLGVLGGICVLGAIASRVISATEGESIFCIIFLLVGIVSIVILVCFVLMIRFVRNDWVDHVPSVKNDDEEDSSEFKNLVGLEGVALSSLRPNGKIVVNNSEYEVYAEGFFIGKDEIVKVVKVEGGFIYVKKV